MTGTRALKAGILAAIASLNLLPPAEAGPGEIINTVSSRFEVTGIDNNDYVIDVLVWWTEGATARAPHLSVTIAPACKKDRCGGRTYVKDLDENELTTDPAAERSVRLRTRFGGKHFDIQWIAGDPEPLVGGSSVGYRRYVISANNALNASCYGDGEHLALVAGGEEPPRGKPLPAQLPAPFWRDPPALPRCTTRSPHDHG